MLKRFLKLPLCICKLWSFEGLETLVDCRTKHLPFFNDDEKRKASLTLQNYEVLFKKQRKRSRKFKKCKFETLKEKILKPK